MGISSRPQSSVAGYLAKYVCGSPISGRRTEGVTDTEVVFGCRDHRDGQQKLKKLSPQDFLTRWFEHVPSRDLRMIRRCDLYANSCAQLRARICEQLPTESPTETAAAEPARGRIIPLERDVCPVCNTQVRSPAAGPSRLKSIGIFPRGFPRGQPQKGTPP
ncbi:MAG: transposase [Planctomycetaceae bacterium]